MSSLLNRKHDVFVSYDWTDNLQKFGLDGWVTNLVKSLTKQLTALAGSDVDILMKPKSGLGFNAERQDLEQSAILLMIFSPAYMASWSSWSIESSQLEKFIREHPRRAFVVETSPIASEPLDAVLTLPTYYHFWTEEDDGSFRTLGDNVFAQGTDSKFASLISKLANDIHSTLQFSRNAFDWSFRVPNVPPVAAAPMVPEKEKVLSKTNENAPREIPPAPARAVGRGGVFVSYSHRDKRWLDRFQTHIAPFVDSGLDVWDDTKIEAGSDWKAEIEKALAAAKVAVLLVSTDFLASRFIVRNELPPLLAAAEQEGVLILSVIVAPCRFEQNPISKYQAINSPKETLAEVGSAARERIWLKLVERIEKALLR